MNFVLCILSATVLFIVMTILGAVVNEEWLKFLGLILLCMVIIFGIIGAVFHTTIQTTRIVETETYQLAPLLAGSDGKPTIVDGKYVIVNDERVQFSYFTEDGVSTGVSIDADYVDFNDADENTMDVTVKIGKLATREEYYSIFFMEFADDCTLYELRVPEDAILYKPNDGKYAQLEEVVD